MLGNETLFEHTLDKFPLHFYMSDNNYVQLYSCSGYYLVYTYAEGVSSMFFYVRFDDAQEMYKYSKKCINSI